MTPAGDRACRSRAIGGDRDPPPPRRPSVPTEPSSQPWMTGPLPSPSVNVSWRSQDVSRWRPSDRRRVSRRRGPRRRCPAGATRSPSPTIRPSDLQLRSAGRSAGGDLDVRASRRSCGDRRRRSSASPPSSASSQRRGAPSGVRAADVPGAERPASRSGSTSLPDGGGVAGSTAPGRAGASGSRAVRSPRQAELRRPAPDDASATSMPALRPELTDRRLADDPMLRVECAATRRWSPSTRSPERGSTSSPERRRRCPPVDPSPRYAVGR